MACSEIDLDERSKQAYWTVNELINYAFYEKSSAIKRRTDENVSDEGLTINELADKYPFIKVRNRLTRAIEAGELTCIDEYKNISDAKLKPKNAVAWMEHNFHGLLPSVLVVAEFKEFIEPSFHAVKTPKQEKISKTAKATEARVNKRNARIIAAQQIIDEAYENGEIKKLHWAIPDINGERKPFPYTVSDIHGVLIARHPGLRCVEVTFKKHDMPLLDVTLSHGKKMHNIKGLLDLLSTPKK